MTHDESRRRFLRSASLLATTPLALNLAVMSNAAAQTANDYRALVCLYLGGGNDHFSTFVPFDTTSFNQYSAIRGGLALARPASGALATTRPQNGRQIALSDELAGVKGLYDQGRVAVLSSVGPLTAPSTKSDLLAGRVAYPRQIGSHNDQANLWLTLGGNNPLGWGGRIGDAVASLNGRANLTTISGNGGYTVYLVGEQTSFFVVSDGGIPSAFFDGDVNKSAAVLGGGSAQRANLLEKAYVQTHEGLRDGAALLQSNAVAEGSLAAPPSQNVLAGQLLTVARIAGAHQALGMRRQVFFVDYGGFDTHNGQNDRHPGLLRGLNSALVYFDSLLGQLNLRNNVTLFTTSEFGRTYVPNGDGTDHGWGSHHLIMGGAVKGKEIYGALPDMAQQGPDIIQDSLMIPTTATEQYGATLGKWMGLSVSQIDATFPDLTRFASRDLGFMN